MEIRDESALRILVLGARDEHIARVLKSDTVRKSGSKSHFAHTIAEAMKILASPDEPINHIVVEAFMENNEHESPFQFLKLLKDSPYAHIPVLVVAAEPGTIGSSLTDCVEHTTSAFGAQFVAIPYFDPEDHDSPVRKLMRERYSWEKPA